MATIDQRSSGYWQAKVRRKGFPPQSCSFRTKSEAKEWARKIEAEMDRGVFISNKEAEATTLHEALERYLREVTPGKRGAKVEEYRIRAWQDNKLAARTLAALRGADFAAWRDLRLKAGCAASTIQKELALIGHLFKIAKTEWGMEGLQNPLSAVRKPRADNARSRVFVADEEARILAACSPQDIKDGRFTAGAQSPYFRPAVEFALATAMRQSEIAELLWENIDLSRQVALLPLTKNGEPRAVPLSSTAIGILKSLLKPAEEDHLPLLRGTVFGGLTANAIKIAFIRAVKRARRVYEKECKETQRVAKPDFLTDFHFHDLRHVATTRLSKKLPNVIELAAVTGHKDLRMLKRYYHPRAEDLAKKLD